jgi:hypothetical protein
MEGYVYPGDEVATELEVPELEGIASEALELGYTYGGELELGVVEVVDDEELTYVGDTETDA